MKNEKDRMYKAANVIRNYESLKTKIRDVRLGMVLEVMKKEAAE